MRNLGEQALLSVLLFWAVLLSSAFYLNDQDLERIRTKDNADLTSSFEFAFDNGTNSDPGKALYPQAFQVKFSTFNKTYAINFVRLDRDSDEYPIGQANVYTADPITQKPKLHLDGNKNLVGCRVTAFD